MPTCSGATTQWRALPIPAGNLYDWVPDSTYVRRPPFFEGMDPEPTPPTDIVAARVLVSVGDSVTTDHISPAGAIALDSPAARYLKQHGVEIPEFNSYGSRRGNHEVMMRGTFANVRLRNRLVPGVEGGYTRHVPSDEQMSIFDAAMRYADEKVPLIVLAGAEYGTGSSRDWAAKGPALLGIRAVIAVGLRENPPQQPDRHGDSPAAVPCPESASEVASASTVRRRSTSGGSRPD